MRQSSPNVDRLVEDLCATLPLLDEQRRLARPIAPMLPALALLGRCWLSDDPDDAQATHLRRHPSLLGPIVAPGRIPALFDTVRLSYFLAAVALARQNTHRLLQAASWRWESVLAWLVLHGIAEHALWPFIPTALLDELLRPSIRLPGLLASPLQYCILLGAPDIPSAWRRSALTFDAEFESWLEGRGTQAYDLFWLRSRRHLRRGLEQVRDRRSAGAAQVDASDHPVWPATPVLDRDTGRRAETSYQAFGQDFPCLTLQFAGAGGVGPSAWNGIVRIDPIDGAAELFGRTVGVRLPKAWVPPSMLIVQLEPKRAALGGWIRLLLDNREIDVSPADRYAAGPVKLCLPDGLPGTAPGLVFQFMPAAGEAEAAPWGRLRSIRL